MTADAMAPCVARASAVMMLTLQDKRTLVFNEEGFQMPTPSQGWEMLENGNIFLFLNTLRPRQNGRRFADDSCKSLFWDENGWISTKMSLNFVTKGPMNNIPALFQIMAWRRAGDEPLSEPMLVSLPTHICATRPQWVKISLTQGL